jgi:membrane protease YdiL (CAAX protease family)
MPATRPRRGAALTGALGWDALVYGAAEGVLLSALPAHLAWQWTHGLYATHAAPAFVAGLAFSVLVIVVHHLGYPEFRHARGVVMPSIACGLLTVGYLVTGSIWTPILAHVFMHTAAVVKGNALPPHSDAAGAGRVGRAASRGSADVRGRRRRSPVTS